MTNVDPNRNLVAALSYLLGFVTGIVILLVEADDKFVRFHAMQSTIIFLGLFVFNIVVGAVFSQIRFLGVFYNLINLVITIMSLVIWIVSMFQAYKGKVYKWPIAGKLAESKVK